MTQTATPLPVQFGGLLGGIYRLEEGVGESAVGSLVRARHVRLNHAVNVLFMPGNDGIAYDEVERVARDLARLENPFFVRMLDVGRAEDGTPYCVLEHVQGESLAARVARLGPLPQPSVKQVLTQVACALAEAHEKGVIHGNLNASNLLWTELPNGDPFIRLVDFGLEALTSQKRQNRNVGLASAPYRAPELIRQASADARTDIWSFGVTAYFLLSGAYPFAGETPADTFVAILSSAPEELDADISVSRTLRALVYRCLRKSPEERPQSMLELATAVYGGDEPADDGVTGEPTRPSQPLLWRR